MPRRVLFLSQNQFWLCLRVRHFFFLLRIRISDLLVLKTVGDHFCEEEEEEQMITSPIVLNPVPLSLFFTSIDPSVGMWHRNRNPSTQLSPQQDAGETTSAVVSCPLDVFFAK